MNTTQDTGHGRAYDIPALDDIGSNYDDWKFRISTVLKLRGLFGIVKGTEKCPPEVATDPKDQVTVTATYDRWQTRNHQALAEITLTLKQEPLRNVKRYQLASEIWDYLEEHYEGRGQHTMARLLGDVFRATLVDTVPIEQQLSDMREKVHRLRDLGHDLKDSLIAMVMIISLPESYTLLRQHLYMKDKTTLTTDFIIKQILMDEKSREGTPHVALMGHGKGKRPAPSQSSDHEGKKKDVKCFYCKKIGHFKSECKKMKADLASNGNSNNKKGSESREENAKLASAQKETLIKLFMAHEGNPNLAESWIIDSGATSTMTSRREWIYDYIPFKSAVPIGLGDDRVINAVGSGSVRISMDGDGKPTVYKLRDVYYVPNMGTNNLLSVTYMSERNYSTIFGRDECSILKGRNVIGKARKRDKLWILKGKTLSPTQESAHVVRASIDTWHRRLGHAMTQSIKKLVDQSMVTGMEAETEEDGAAHTHCISCLKGKRTRDVIPKKSDVENPRRLHRIYSDVCGPFDVEGYSQCRYFVTFVDGFSHYIRIKPIRTKDEASKVLMNWITRSEVETREQVNFLRTDGGGEYMGNDFQKWLKARGIHHEVTNANTPQENGVAERLNRTVLEMVRTMMFDSKLSKAYWTFAVKYAQEILNRLPTRAVSEDRTPHELFLQKKPSVAHI